MRNLNTALINNRNFGMKYQPDLTNCELHTHSFIEIAYILSGKATHILNGKSEMIRENDYVVIEPGSLHQYIKKGTENLSIINCIFTASFPYPCATVNSFYECIKNPTLNINTKNIKPEQPRNIKTDDPRQESSNRASDSAFFIP